MMTQIAACPLTGRRDHAELIYSLFTTSFVAFAACGHLHHTLLGQNSSEQLAVYLFLFYLSPGWPVCIPLLRVLLTLVRLFVTRHCKVELTMSNNEDISEPQTRIITSVLDPRFWLPFVLFEDVAPDWGADSRVFTTTIYRQERRTSVYFGQVILMVFGLLQCVGTAIRMTRRLTHESGTAIGADHLLFWVSLSGTAILTQSLIVLLSGWRWPITGNKISFGGGGSLLFPIGLMTLIVSVISFILSIRAMSILDDNSTPSTIYDEAVPEILSTSTLFNALFGTAFKTEFKFVPILYMVLLGTWPCLFLLCLRFIQDTLDRNWASLAQYEAGLDQNEAGRSTRQINNQMHWRLTAVCAIIIGPPAFAILFYFFIQYPESIFHSLQHAFYGPDGKSWPEDMPCPQLWKDPLWMPTI